MTWFCQEVLSLASVAVLMGSLAVWACSIAVA